VREVENGKWKMENGKSGRAKGEDGKWKMGEGGGV
jgi:hypothetical protein